MYYSISKIEYWFIFNFSYILIIILMFFLEIFKLINTFTIITYL